MKTSVTKIANRILKIEERLKTTPVTHKASNESIALHLQTGQPMTNT
jgi:hypothetical protein